MGESSGRHCGRYSDDSSLQLNPLPTERLPPPQTFSVPRKNTVSTDHACIGQEQTPATGIGTTLKPAFYLSQLYSWGWKDFYPHEQGRGDHLLSASFSGISARQQILNTGRYLNFHYSLIRLANRYSYFPSRQLQRVPTSIPQDPRLTL